VTVANPLQQEITRYLEATGNTAAVNATNLVARVQGYLQEIKYEDGAMVKQGTPLFIIEPEPYRLKLQQAKAAEEGAQATLTQTEAEFQRQQDLASRQVSSKATFDNARAARDLAKANVDQARANSEQAALNLGYTQVVAPFDGVVTARQVSLGELVGGGTTPTLLATIVQLNPIYVNFSISEQDVLRIRADMARRDVSPADLKGKLPIEVALQTDQGYPHQGVLDYAAPSVNASTGTLAVRARLENADRKLLPGYFARVRVPLLQDKTRARERPGRPLRIGRWCRQRRRAAQSDDRSACPWFASDRDGTASRRSRRHRRADARRSWPESGSADARAIRGTNVPSRQVGRSVA
jgi:RND family efflux transporter MFP subunit